MKDKKCIDGGTHTFNPRYDRKLKDNYTIKAGGWGAAKKIEALKDEIYL